MPRIKRLVGVIFALFGFLSVLPVLGGGSGLSVMADADTMSAPAILSPALSPNTPATSFLPITNST